MSTLTLDDLGEVRHEIEVVRPDGRKLAVPLRAMSEQEIWKLRQSINWPVRPMEPKRGADGSISEAPITSGPLFDNWQKAQQDADRQFQYRLVLHSLCIDVPGTTEEERVRVLEGKLGAWAFNWLNAQVLRLTGITESEVVSTANSFPSN